MKALQNTTIQQIWLGDLDNFEKLLDEVEDMEDKEMR